MSAWPRQIRIRKPFPGRAESARKRLENEGRKNRSPWKLTNNQIKQLRESLDIFRRVIKERKEKELLQALILIASWILYSSCRNIVVFSNVKWRVSAAACWVTINQLMLRDREIESMIVGDTVVSYISRAVQCCLQRRVEVAKFKSHLWWIMNVSSFFNGKRLVQLFG